MAFDFDLSGTIDAGTGAVNLYGSQASQTIGLGATPFNMAISDAELGKITTTGGLTIGSTQSGSMTVSAIASITKSVSLVASRNYAQVLFLGSASAFYGVAVQADDGVVVSKAVTTQTGVLYLNGDLDLWF